MDMRGHACCDGSAAMKLSTLLLVFATMAGCTAQVDSYFEDVPDEPALSTDEIAALPDGTEVEHGADLEAAIAAAPPVDDASAYDADDVEPMVDVEVTDSDPDAPAPYAALLKWGLHPRASDAFRAAGVSAGRIMQTIGHASASAGTHATDGYVNGQPYSAATDISVSGLSQTQIRNLLEKLAKVGFAAWYRQSGHDGWSRRQPHPRGLRELQDEVVAALAGALVARRAQRPREQHDLSLPHLERGREGNRQGEVGDEPRGHDQRRRGRRRPREHRGHRAEHPRERVDDRGDRRQRRPTAAYVAITCQKRGTSVKGTYGTTTLWDKINGGYVSDAYVSTGSDGQVAPTCH